MNNIEIRVELMRYRIKQKDLAEMLGVTEPIISRDLRNELSEARRALYWRLIEEIKHDRQGVAQ